MAKPTTIRELRDSGYTPRSVKQLLLDGPGVYPLSRSSRIVVGFAMRAPFRWSWAHYAGGARPLSIRALT